MLPDEVQTFYIEQSHQLANFADFCNECGNCDTFCPEYGGPFIEKPAFFATRASYEGRPKHDGFYIERANGSERITGRIQGREYRLEMRRAEDKAIYSDGTVELTLQPSSGKLLEWKALEPALAQLDPAREPFTHTPDHVVSMRNYYRLEALLRGILNTTRVHYVNTPFL